jgi:UDP-glucose 4-epimerase
MKIAITGSRGRIGSYVYRQVVAAGHDALGIDLPARADDQNYICADTTDFGAIVDALHGCDAVIHLAAIPDSRLVASSKTFASNMAGIWNIYEACRVLGIRRAVFASTIQALISSVRRNPTPFAYFPVDEAHPLDPQSDYSLSKALGEQVGAMFARHYGLTVVSLRFMWVTTPEETRTLPAERPTDTWHPALYAYCDVRDTARACVLAATVDLPANSHTAAFVTARDTWVTEPSAQIVAEHFPNSEDRGLRGFDSLISGETARRVLGFESEFSCRDPR